MNPGVRVWLFIHIFTVGKHRTRGREEKSDKRRLNHYSAGLVCIHCDWFDQIPFLSVRNLLCIDVADSCTARSRRKAKTTWKTALNCIHLEHRTNVEQCEVLVARTSTRSRVEHHCDCIDCVEKWYLQKDLHVCLRQLHNHAHSKLFYD